MIEVFNVIVFGLAVLMASSLTTFFHEMGHAIPALIFTKKKPIIVVIGSYGEEAKYYDLHIGRLKIYFRFNLLNWRAGICSTEEQVHYKQDILITIGGPILSLALAIITGIIITTIPLAVIWKILGVIYILLGIFDFIINIIPSEFYSEAFPEEKFKTDGLRLKELISLGNSYEAYHTIINGSDDVCNSLIDLYNTTKNKYVGIKAFAKLVENKRFKEAEEFSKELYKSSGPSENSFDIIGDMYYGLGQKEDAIKYYTTYLYHNIEAFHIKNKKARILFELGQDLDALKLLKNSIYQNRDLNRNLNIDAFLLAAKILLKIKPREAKVYLDEALSIEKKNPELMLGFAQYYEKLNDTETAIKYYKLARHYGSDYHGLEYKIETL